jgi:hypothetical protein
MYASSGYRCPRRSINWRWNCFGHTTGSRRPYCPRWNRPPARFVYYSSSRQSQVVDMHVVVLIMYIALATEFLVRFTLDRPVRHIRHLEGCITVKPRRGTVDTSMKHLLFGMSVMTVLLLTRSIYRTTELAGGWGGKVISTQWLFSQSLCRDIWIQ